MSSIDAFILLEAAVGLIFLVVLWVLLFGDAFGDRARIQLRSLEQRLFVETINGTRTFGDPNYRTTLSFLNSAYSIVGMSPLSFFLLVLPRPNKTESDSGIIDATRPRYFRDIEHEALQVLVALMVDRSLILLLAKKMMTLGRSAVKALRLLVSSSHPPRSAERPSAIYRREPILKERILRKAEVLGRKPSPFQELSNCLAGRDL